MIYNYLFLSLNVLNEICTDQVPVIIVGDCRDDFHQDISLSKHALSDNLEDFLQLRRDILVRTGGWHDSFKVIDLFYSCTKDEDILNTYLFVYLYISTIHRSKNQATIHNKLHIWRSWSLSTCSGNMLTDIRCWYDNLCIRYVIVRQEY